jgi:hypothetical protein
MNRLLSTRVFPSTICPSEVARAIKGVELHATGAGSWRDLMPLVRELAWERRAGVERDLEVLQGGQVVPDSVSLNELRGPIRLRANHNPN